MRSARIFLSLYVYALSHRQRANNCQRTREKERFSASQRLPKQLDIKSLWVVPKTSYVPFADIALSKILSKLCLYTCVVTFAIVRISFVYSGSLPYNSRPLLKIRQDTIQKSFLRCVSYCSYFLISF